VVAARDAARDRKCVGPKYPGGPALYRYRLTESCVAPTDPGLKAARAAKRAVKRSTAAEARRVDAEDERRIRKVLQTQYGDSQPPEEIVAPAEAAATFAAVAAMLSPVLRKRHPDPEARFVAVAKRMLKAHGPDRGRVGRFVVFQMTLLAVRHALT
jgi:hypothetical protein